MEPVTLVVGAAAVLLFALSAAGMASITLSPLLVDIRGKVADAVFSKWKGKNYVRARVTPSNPQTTAQVTQREALADALIDWQSLKTWARDVWDRYASGYDQSGYNMFMGENIPHVRDAEAGLLVPDNAEHTGISAASASAGAVGEIDCDWTDEGLGANSQVFALYRKTTDTAFTKTADVLASAATLTISSLDTGVEYYVAIVAYDDVTDLYQQSVDALLNAG